MDVECRIHLSPSVGLQEKATLLDNCYDASLLDIESALAVSNVLSALFILSTLQKDTLKQFILSLVISLLLPNLRLLSFFASLLLSIEVPHSKDICDCYIGIVCK